MSSQLSYMGVHPELDEHVMTLRDHVQGLVDDLYNQDIEGEVALTVKHKLEITTVAGHRMKGVVTVKIDAKPAPEPRAGRTNTFTVRVPRRAPLFKGNGTVGNGAAHTGGEVSDTQQSMSNEGSEA
jgi:hypothetical protein